ncbi:trophozoite exported protein 1-like [Mytilus edulis]|uniref:trophozoite exported protein 1-like n=1 Tax=Mytilus edulis TaxID=6550 RepID=UPI0039F06607
MERNNAFINIYEDEVLEQSKGSCKPLLNNYKTEDQTNNSSAIRESCYSFCNEGGNTEEEPKGNANAHGCIQDTKFSCNNRSMDATECQNIGSEYNVDEKLELVILENNDKIKKTSILDEQDEFNDGDIADTKDSSLIHTENNISIQIEGQLGRAVGQHENRSETNTRKTFAVKDEKTNNQITEESDDVNKFGNMNLVEGEPIKKSFNKITLQSDNRESEINSESKTIEKKKKNKMKTLAFVLAENVETQYCSLDPNDRALADHEQVYNTIRKDSTDNEENKNYLLDKICRTLEDREHIYNDTKDDLKPETKVKQDLDRTNLDENYGMRNSFDDIEDERRQHENNDDSYHLTELKSIANHASIENNEVECEISDVSIINSFDEVNEENSDGQVNLIEDNEAIYESIRDEDSLRDFRFQDFDENERFYRRRERRKQIFQVLVVGILSIMMMTVIALVISLKNGM